MLAADKPKHMNCLKTFSTCSLARIALYYLHNFANDNKHYQTCVTQINLLLVRPDVAEKWIWHKLGWLMAGWTCEKMGNCMNLYRMRDDRLLKIRWQPGL